MSDMITWGLQLQELLLLPQEGQWLRLCEPGLGILHPPC